MSYERAAVRNTTGSVNDKPTSVTEDMKVTVKIQRTFPWCTFLLGASILVLYSQCYLEGNSRWITRADGTTGNTNKIYPARKLFQFPDFHDKKPVLSVVVSPSSRDSVMSVTAALGLMLAAIMSVIELFRSRYVYLVYQLTTLCLMKTAYDLARCLATSITHYHYLQRRIGHNDAISLLIFSVTINAFQWLLWCGGLQFQKSLLTSE